MGTFKKRLSLRGGFCQKTDVAISGNHRTGKHFPEIATAFSKPRDDSSCLQARLLLEGFYTLLAGKGEGDADMAGGTVFLDAGKENFRCHGIR